MSGNLNDSSSPAAGASRSRRNRRLRSPDAAAHASKPAASGSPHSRPSFQPIAPRVGQGRGSQTRSGSGLHQTIHNHYHYSPYEGTNGAANGSGSGNGNGVTCNGNGDGDGEGDCDVHAGTGRPGSAARGGGEGPAMNARGPEWGFMNNPQGRAHGQNHQSQNQGYDFLAANTYGYWPGPEMRPRPWFPPPRHPMFYPPQNGGGVGGPPGDFYMEFSWGRSPDGA